MGKTSFKLKTTLTSEKEAKEGKDPFLALRTGPELSVGLCLLKLGKA